MTAPAAVPCPACRQVLPLDPHLAGCPEIQARAATARAPRELGRQGYAVLRLAEDPRGRHLEETLESCNRRARAWLQVRGRAFP